MPDECVKLWNIFSCMRNVTYSEIKSYADVTGEELTPIDSDILISFERARREEPEWPR